VYQLNETEARHELPEEPVVVAPVVVAPVVVAPVVVASLPARRGGRGRGRSYARLHVVRVPGGFAHVEDRPAIERV
jgi:hypothetical protein